MVAEVNNDVSLYGNKSLVGPNPGTDSTLVSYQLGRVFHAVGRGWAMTSCHGLRGSLRPPVLPAVAAEARLAVGSRGLSFLVRNGWSRGETKAWHPERNSSPVGSCVARCAERCRVSFVQSRDGFHPRDPDSFRSERECLYGSHDVSWVGIRCEGKTRRRWWVLPRQWCTRESP